MCLAHHELGGIIIDICLAVYHFFTMSSDCLHANYAKNSYSSAYLLKLHALNLIQQGTTKTVL